MRISKQEERWFPVPDDPDEASVLIKHLSPGEIQDIVDDVMVQEIEYPLDDKGDRANPVVRQKNNRRKDREKTILACVKGWKGFFDGDKEMECTKENILRAIREIDGFSEFVAVCRTQLAADIADERVAQKKTS